MKYMGSKSRIVKHIAPIIQRCIDDNDVKSYIEPFVGGANVIDHIVCSKKIGYDKNEYVIELFKHIQNGGELLGEVPRSLYNSVREDYRLNTGAYDKWMTANVGFLASYNGRWFDGGYAQPGYERTKNGDRYRDYYQEAKRNIEAQSGNLLDVDFEVSDYKDLDFSELFGAVIYCDPPYADTKNYINSKDFNYGKFWESVRQWSYQNYVLVSEQSAPDDFMCLWEASVSRSIKAKDKSSSTEKLFAYKSGIYARYLNYAL